MTKGPLYDNALRLLAATDLVAVCRWLGVDAAPGSIRLPESLPAATKHADLIARVDGRHLAHVEFVRAPTRGLPQRMLEYRALIMGGDPEQVVTQHVVVLDRGRVPPRYVNGLEFAMRLHVTYLRDHDPQAIHLDAVTVEETTKEASVPITLEGTVRR